MSKETKSLVLDQPDQIEAYRLLATYYGLRIELASTDHGWPATATPTRGRALASAQGIAQQYQVPGRFGTRRTAFRSLGAWLRQRGLLKEEEG